MKREGRSGLGHNLIVTTVPSRLDGRKSTVIPEVQASLPRPDPQEAGGSPGSRSKRAGKWNSTWNE